MLRPTASFSAYHDFIRSLVQHMKPRHFAAYRDGVFRYYVHFGPPGVDLPTFEHILRQWDKKRKKFVFTDRNDGEEIACSFNLEWVMPQDIDEDIEQPNEAVEKIEWPQQVIYWKSIASMNQVLRRDNKNKFKDMITADRVKISVLSVKVAKLSAQNRRLREKLSEARSRTLSVYKDKMPTELVSGSLMEPQTYTLREDTGRKIKQSEDVPLPAPDTSTEDEDAHIKFLRALNKRKRGANRAREKVSDVEPLKGKRCRRAMKPSKWVVTPYTKWKKKKEKDNIGDKAIVEVSGEEEE
ncbi:uncharacterized protein A4U43_C10F4640 [Asparagus officinalis]|uniref:Uncharacterized protein n=1 Tax=Asparagus officinalis TaxID=4686 RepID=A0A5P1E0Y3_ASPOF|nr:uncharacterized protein A4U43_C10F4640 [Asparagus officinalis]